MKQGLSMLLAAVFAILASFVVRVSLFGDTFEESVGPSVFLGITLPIFLTFYARRVQKRANLGNTSADAAGSAETSKLDADGVATHELDEKGSLHPARVGGAA